MPFSESRLSHLIHLMVFLCFKKKEVMTLKVSAILTAAMGGGFLNFDTNHRIEEVSECSVFTCQR